MMVTESTNAGSSGSSLAAIWQRKGFILTVMAVAVAFAGLLLLVITPRYTAEALIALNRSNTIIASNSAVVGTQYDGAFVRTETEILKSRRLAAQVLDELGLTNDPEFNKELRKNEGMRAQFSAWLADTSDQVKAWAAANIPGMQSVLGREAKEPAEITGLTGDALRRTRIVDDLLERVSVKPDAESYTIHLKFEASTAEKAARIANAFADIYIRNQVETRYAEIDQATGWITRQVTDMRRQVAEATAAVAEYRQKHGMSPLNSDQGQLSAQQLLALNTELSAIERDRADAETKLKQAKDMMARGGDVRALEFVGTSLFVRQLRQQEAELLGRIAEQSSRYRDDHPQVAALKAQVAGIRRDMSTEVNRMVTTLEGRVAQAKAREETLRARMQSISHDAISTSRTSAELAQLERDVTAKNMLLDGFIQRYNEISSRMEIERPDARIASRAEAPADPSHPKSVLFLGIAVIGSLGLAVSLVLLLERFRPGFVTVSQVKDELALPTLAVIPQVRRLGRHKSLSTAVLDSPTSPYAEAVRSAQLAILNARTDEKANGILVASSLPGEGKSAFAVALARSLASNGYRTLLVDCDLRRPAVARLLGGRNAPGFTDYLIQQNSLDEIVRLDEQSGLHYIAAGSRCEDPQKMLNSALAGTTLAALREKFDLVIIDSPPTMVASDSAVLAKICDLALYIVEWDKTPRRAVQAGVDYLQSFGVRIAGVVLSKVDFDRQRQYSDYVDFAFRDYEYYGK